MNELIEWIRRNAGLVLLGIIGLLILSIFIGFVIGTVLRRNRMREIGIGEGKTEAYRERTFPEEGGAEMILPQSVIPELGGDSADYLFFFDQKEPETERLAIIPLEVSELLKSRDIGVSNDVKAFEFHNQVHDVLTDVNELADP